MSGPLSPAEPRRAAREVELSLVIACDDPEGVLQRLARLREVGPYRLAARGSEQIEDRYFDTPDGALGKQGVALRLRTVKGATTIGVKGRQRSGSTQTEDRSEVERPFSPEAVEEIARRTGLERMAAEEADGPDELLAAALGVRPIQRRETVRLVRDVTDSREASGPVLAELVLDRVRFDVGDSPVLHYEVEIEAKRTGRGTESAKAIAAELAGRYPELAEWPYGKLPTGRAVEALLRRARLPGVGPDGALTPPAYEAIRKQLER